VMAYPGGLGGSKEAMMVTMAGMGRALLPTGLVEGTRASRKCGTGPEGGGEAAGGHVRGGEVRDGAGCGRMGRKGAGRACLPYGFDAWFGWAVD
jgi:hypothetical protein